MAQIKNEQPSYIEVHGRRFSKISWDVHFKKYNPSYMFFQRVFLSGNTHVKARPNNCFRLSYVSTGWGKNIIFLYNTYKSNKLFEHENGSLHPLHRAHVSLKKINCSRLLRLRPFYYRGPLNPRDTSVPESRVPARGNHGYWFST